MCINTDTTKHRYMCPFYTFAFSHAGVSVNRCHQREECRAKLIFYRENACFYYSLIITDLTGTVMAIARRNAGFKHWEGVVLPIFKPLRGLKTCINSWHLICIFNATCGVFLKHNRPLDRNATQPNRQEQMRARPVLLGKSKIIPGGQGGGQI